MAFSDAVPSTTAPSMNDTAPVGTPAAGATGFTVAVNVTGCPTPTGLADAVSRVVVLPLLIVSVTTLDVLGATFASPT